MLGGDCGDAVADIVAEAGVEHAEARVFTTIEVHDVLPGLARQRHLAVPAVAEGALDKDGKFNARACDAVADFAESLAENRDEVTGGSTLRMEAEADEIAVDADVAVLAENLRNGEVLMAGENGDYIVEMRFHGKTIVH